MRFVKSAVFFVIAAIAFTFRVSAASFADDMIAPQNTSGVQYSGLKPYTGATHGLSDQTLLTFLNNSAPQGYALYRVNAAEIVTAGIYTFYGTCVAQKETGLMLGQGTKQAAWSKSKNMIYSDLGGRFWHIELDFENRYDPVFSLTNALPEDLAGFGLNIYALPGTNKPLPVSVTKSVSEALCYEEYTAAVPAGTQYIKVEINDVPSYPLKGGGTMPNRIYTSLASVKISGEALVMGEPAKVEREPSAQTQAPAYDGEEEEKTDSYIAAFAAEPPIDEPEPEDESAASSEKSSSSKFEGTITSSSKQERSQSPAANVQAESSVSTVTGAESASSKEESPREIIYEIRREDGGGAISSGVTAYIIIALGALALLLIFGRRK